MKVRIIRWPTEEDWKGCLWRAWITMGKGLEAPKAAPSDGWRKSILEARHSPIRYLMFSFLIEGIPSNTATHLCRHVHAQPYVESLRNDRQDNFDGDEAPRNTPVNMILDVNAEELMVIANKRLCQKASKKTMAAVRQMCKEAARVCPELENLLVPMCFYHGGTCHEMLPCGHRNGFLFDSFDEEEQG